MSENIMGNGGGSHRQPQQQQQPLQPPGTPHSVPGSQRGHSNGAGIPISCNRCRKPLNTTLFVCACDCVFCEECTYNHFNSSSNCPSCNRVLSENDFMELVVADPSASATNASTKTTHFQNLFTKQNAANRALPFQDLCSRMLKQQDDCRAGTKFLMKQLLLDASKQGHRFQQLLRAFEGVKQELTTHKQSTNSQKMRYEKVIENLQNQLASANKKIEEKDRQIHQFRKLHNRMTPESPSNSRSNAPLHGQVGNESRRVSTGGQSATHSHRPEVIPHSSSGSQQQHPPIQGFMIQKEAQERARQRAIDASQHRNAPLLGGTNRLINPYDGYPGSRPRSSGSAGSGGIRNISSASGYAFTGGSNNDYKRRRAMSPSQAMAMQPSGTYSVTRGPTNFFHQGGSGSSAGGYPGGRRP